MAKKDSVASFGEKLRKLREKEGLSLDELAAQVSMKPSHLKSLEEDKILPPVAEIISLARTLSVEPSVFMGGEPAGASQGKRRTALARRTRDYAYENLTSEEHDKHLLAFRVTIDPRSAHPQVGYRHEGEEFIYVLSGRLNITIGGVAGTLNPGESIHFDSGKRHMLKNTGKEPTVLLVVIYMN